MKTHLKKFNTLKKQVFDAVMLIWACFFIFWACEKYEYFLLVSIGFGKKFIIRLCLWLQEPVWFLTTKKECQIVIMNNLRDL